MWRHSCTTHATLALSTDRRSSPFTPPFAPRSSPRAPFTPRSSPFPFPAPFHVALQRPSLRSFPLPQSLARPFAPPLTSSRVCLRSDARGNLARARDRRVEVDHRRRRLLPMPVHPHRDRSLGFSNFFFLNRVESHAEHGRPPPHAPRPLLRAQPARVYTHSPSLPRDSARKSCSGM